MASEKEFMPEHNFCDYQVLSMLYRKMFILETDHNLLAYLAQTKHIFWAVDEVAFTPS